MTHLLKLQKNVHFHPEITDVVTAEVIKEIVAAVVVQHVVAVVVVVTDVVAVADHVAVAKVEIAAEVVQDVHLNHKQYPQTEIALAAISVF